MTAVRLKPGTLASAVDGSTARALASGAQQPIETHEIFIDDGGVRFVVRAVSSLHSKQEKRQKQEHNTVPDNPFLPYEQALFVADLSDRHVCLLNKFNVINRHVLIVTKHFEHQHTLLNESDFAVLWACMAEYDSLGFYNGGQIAGASQEHKHLQMIPLPIATTGEPVPMQSLFQQASVTHGLQEAPGLSFKHAYVRLHESETAVTLMDKYRSMLAATGVGIECKDGETCQAAPYNLIMTRQWMLVVPRIKEHYRSISVNALGFAGSLFVRSQGQFDEIYRVGPMQVLRSVAKSRQ